MKKYHIYAYKHYWLAGGIDENDISMPYEKDHRDFVIEADSDKEAIQLAEKEYGSGEYVDPKTGQYIDNPDGSWTLMGIKKVEILK